MVAALKQAIAALLANHSKLSFTGKKPVRAAILATNIGTNTRKPQLALNPIPRNKAVIYSFSKTSLSYFSLS